MHILIYTKQWTQSITLDLLIMLKSECLQALKHRQLHNVDLCFHAQLCSYNEMDNKNIRHVATDV